MNIIKQLTDSNGNNIYPIAYAQGGMKIDLLWTNPSPTASFAAQTVSLDLSEYEIIGVYLLLSPSYKHLSIMNLFTTDGLGVADDAFAICGNDGTYVQRKITSISPNGITFDSGYNGSSANNQYAIPYKIFGIKTSYVVPTSVHGLQYVEV